jgi:hypothetical protein
MFKCATIIGALLVALFLGSFAASPQQQGNDYGVQSISVVRQFVMSELRGGRLTAAGWRRVGNEFFVKPEPFSSTEEVRVVSDKFSLRLDTLTHGPAATVEADFPVCWGRIDSALRFHPTDEGVPPGLPVLAKCSESYNLIFSGQECELGVDGKVTPFAGTINMEGMRIKTFPNYVTLNRAAAIRYLSETRDKSNDPAVKKNATQTLAALAKLKD